MKDMERWAKIQNRQKECVRSPSPVLRSGAEDKKASKAADAAFAVFERKVRQMSLFVCLGYYKIPVYRNVSFLYQTFGSYAFLNIMRALVCISSLIFTFKPPPQ